MKRTPVHCPSCESELVVTDLLCARCETGVTGHYRLPALLRLSADDQSFIESFVVESGSLKAMASRLGVSYPTVRNRLDDVIKKLQEETGSAV